MIKTKIDWTDYSWNPITGCYGPEGSFEERKVCPYCYAKKMAVRQRGRNGYRLDDPFRPTFHKDRLEEPKKSNRPSKIFTVSMGDMFGETIPQVWIKDILEVIEECYWHIFIILTKNPKRMLDYSFPKNVWVGTSKTIASPEIGYIQDVSARIRFLSFEPLYGGTTDYIDLKNIHWIIIGGETGARKERQGPNKEVVENILRWADKRSIPVFMKENLSRYGISPDRKEFPE